MNDTNKEKTKVEYNERQKESLIPIVNYLLNGNEKCTKETFMELMKNDNSKSAISIITSQKAQAILTYTNRDNLKADEKETYVKLKKDITIETIKELTNLFEKENK